MDISNFSSSQIKTLNMIKEWIKNFPENRTDLSWKNSPLIKINEDGDFIFIHQMIITLCAYNFLSEKEKLEVLDFSRSNNFWPSSNSIA